MSYIKESFGNLQREASDAAHGTQDGRQNQPQQIRARSTQTARSQTTARNQTPNFSYDGVVQRQSTPQPRPRSAWEVTTDPVMASALTGAPMPEAQVRAVQAKGQNRTDDPAAVQRAAAAGISGSGSALPHLDSIQASFGHHDVSQVRAYVGGEAERASEQIGAQAYATGEHVAFHSQPDLHTAAHEAAHVVQQRLGVALSGGVGQAGDAYERHADAVADRVVAGQSAADLLTAGPSGGAHGQHGGVQKKPVDTAHGTFNDESFTDILLGNKKIGIDIHLSFTPNEKVDASKIGLAQAVKSYNEGQPEYMHEAQEDLTVKNGQSAGYGIDRVYGNNNPIYGSEQAQPGQGLADTAVSNAPANEAPDASKDGNATYILGHRVQQGENKWDEKKAELHDAPQLGSRGKNAGQEFETTALAIDGTQKGTYYGSVRWGWKSDDKGEFTPIELTHVSDGAPSDNFTKAAKLWNQHVFSPRIAEPNQDGDTRTTDTLTVRRGDKSFTIAAGTRLSVDLNGKPIGNDMLVTLADTILLKDGGIFFMGWVEQAALDNDTLRADTRMEFQDKEAVVAKGAKVARTGSVVGSQELVTIMDGVVSELDFDHRIVWAEVVDMKGGNTVDLPGVK